MQLLLQDLPGVKLEPLSLNGAGGVSEGQTALEISAKRGDRLIAGSLGLDNYGAEASGIYRFAFSSTLTDLLGFGDVLTLAGSVTDKYTLAGSLGFSAPIGYQGLRGQATYSHSEFSLPQTSVAGSADSVRLGFAYPIKRGLDANWTVSLDAGFAESRQTVAGIQAFPPRDLYTANLTLSGNSGDRGIQLGQSFWSAVAIVTHGLVKQDLLGATDTTGVLGQYNKFKGLVTVKENLGDSKFYILGDLRTQVADSNLDGSEKLPIGGISGVRAYRADEGSFDGGGILSLELRRLFVLPSGDALAPGVIFDIAAGVFNIAPYPNWQTNAGYSDPNLNNFRVVAGLGPSIDWISPRGFTASLTYAMAAPGSPDSINFPGSTNQIRAALGFRF